MTYNPEDGGSKLLQITSIYFPIYSYYIHKFNSVWSSLCVHTDRHIIIQHRFLKKCRMSDSIQLRMCANLAHSTNQLSGTARTCTPNKQQCIMKTEVWLEDAHTDTENPVAFQHTSEQWENEQADNDYSDDLCGTTCLILGNTGNFSWQIQASYDKSKFLITIKYKTI
jgi:hypothetical protein